MGTNQPGDQASIAPARAVLNGTGVTLGHDLRAADPPPRFRLVRTGTDPNSAGACPDRAIGYIRAQPDHRLMQVAPGVPSRARAPMPRRSLLPSVGLAVAGIVWLAIAGASAWLVFGTPLMERLVVLDSRDAAGPLLGAAAWAVALTAPACFAILGIVRLAGAGAHVHQTRRAIPPVARRAAMIPPGCTVIPRVQLPDGSRIPDVVVGPHGLAFFEPLPPSGAVRRVGERWEVRFSDRRWHPIENPLLRAVRDGDRLRRHLDAQEHDFVARVTAAVIRDRYDVGPIDGCAVVALDDVPAWLAALPAQRNLTLDRQGHLRDLLQELAVS
jgi:hypothetical protein